jgi:hypothetical protein
MQIAFMTDQTAPEVIYPFRMWWGLAFCAAFLALVMVFGMSSDGSTFPVDKGDM